MRARAVVFDARTAETLREAIVAADARAADGSVALRKGARIGDAGRDAIAALSGREIHVVELDPSEVTQDEAADRLARVLAGSGTAAEPASQGQARLRATARGVLRVRAEVVRAVNERPPLLLFTHLDGQVVEAGEEVAGVKSAALATPERLLAATLGQLSATEPAVRVAAFRRSSVCLIVTERIEPRGREMVVGALRRKLAWYGSTLVRVAEVEHARGPMRDALAAAAADIVLVSGASPLDPLDPAILALADAGGSLVRSGVPGHPGSMVWTGTLTRGAAAAPSTVIGVATCAGFGRETALDLVLSRVLAGEPPDSAVNAIGYGGMLEGPAGSARFPRYDASTRPS